MGSINRDNPALVAGCIVPGGRLEEDHPSGPNSARGSRSNHKTVELSFPQALDFCLRLVTSTCAGYDDDAQICCEHGGEGGQNVSLTAEGHKTSMTGGGDGPDRCSFSFLLCTLFFFF